MARACPWSTWDGRCSTWTGPRRPSVTCCKPAILSPRSTIWTAPVTPCTSWGAAICRCSGTRKPWTVWGRPWTATGPQVTGAGRRPRCGPWVPRRTAPVTRPRHVNHGPRRWRSSSDSATRRRQRRCVPSRTRPAFPEIPVRLRTVTDTMLRAPVIHPPGSGGQSNERTIMGNLAVAEELASSEELDELYKLDASESDPEDDDDEDD